MSTNAPQVSHYDRQMLKTSVLVLCSSFSLKFPSSLFHLFSSPPPCCSAQLNSTSPLFPSPVPCPSAFLSSAQHSHIRVLASPLGSLSSPRLSDLSCGSRGLIYSPNILSATCAHAQKKKTHTHFRLPDLNVFWATFSLSESKRELRPTPQPAPLQQIHV